MKKRFLKALSSKVLAAAAGAAVLIQAQAPVLAGALDSPLYISEVFLSYGETDEKAKQWLKDNGYEILDQNLNEKAAGGISWLGISFSKERSVYLGYKTTTDSDEAIRDMRAMNMNGDYSYDEYEKVLENKKTEITAFISSMKTALAEYRENYKNGSLKAKIAHDRMNQALDDDCGFSGLGDLLLEPIKEEMTEAEYNKEPTKHVDMTTVLMQGNISSVNALMSDLCLAADSSENGWIARFRESGVTRLFDRYEEEYPQLSESKLTSLIQSEYDEDAKLLAQKLVDLKESLKAYTDCPVKSENGTEEIEKYFKEHPEQNINDWSRAASEYLILSETSFGNGTLLDLVSGDKYDFNDADDRSALYPILDVMSKGQRSLLSYVDLGELVITGNLDGEGWKETQKKAENLLAVTLPESVYSGIDRTVFQPGGIALTSQARDIQSATGSSYSSQLFGVNTTAIEIAGAASSLIVLAAGICSFSYGNAVITTENRKVVKEIFEVSLNDDKLLKRVADNMKKSEESVGSMIRDFMLQNDYKSMDTITTEMSPNILANILHNKERTKGMIVFRSENGSDRVVSCKELFSELNKSDRNFDDTYIKYNLNRASYENSMESLQSTEKTTIEKSFGIRSQAWKTAGVVLCVAAALIAIGTAVVAIYDEYKYYHRDYAPIPDKIVHESTDDMGRFSYTVYNVTPCNRAAQGFGKDELGINGDMNGDVGKQWLALYTTKDKAAGDPITADIIAQKGSNKMPLDKTTGIRLFGKSDTVNIVSTEYGYTDAIGGLYIFSGTEATDAKSGKANTDSSSKAAVPEESSAAAENISSETETASEAAAVTEDSSSTDKATAAGSVVGTGVMVGSCAGSAALGALICFLIVRTRRKDSAA